MRMFDQTIEKVVLRLPFGIAISIRKSAREREQYWAQLMKTQQELAQMCGHPQPWGPAVEQRQVCSNPAPPFK